MKMSKRFIPIKYKTPIVKDWVNSNYTFEQCISQFKPSSIGWVLDKDDLIVDVDVKNGKQGMESYERLLKDLNITLYPNVKTKTGGLHIYLKKDPNIKIHKNISKYKDIDFLSYGCYCVYPTNSNDYTFIGETESHKSPDVLIDLIKVKVKNYGVFEIYEDDDFDTSWSNERLSTQQVIDIVNKLDNNSIDYNYWFKIGCAIKYSLGDNGFSVFDEWSKICKEYDKVLTQKTWDNIKEYRGDAVNIQDWYLLKQLNNQNEKFIINQINNSNSDADLEVVLDYIKNNNISNKIKDAVLPIWQKKHLEVTGINRHLSSIKNEVGRVIEVNKVNSVLASSPEIFKDLFILKSHSRFVFLNNINNMYDIVAFNTMYSKFASDINGKPIKAYDFVTRYGLVQEANFLEYLPNVDEKVINRDGINIINSFDNTKLPRPATEFSVGGKEAVNRLNKHLSILFNNDEKDLDFFNNWIAHNVQNKGCKLLYAPLIQGIQGVGKSYIGFLLRMLLGNDNVGVVASEHISGNHNSWSIGKCINVIEELYISPSKIYETLNALKPLITDTKILVNRKNIDHYQITNVTNYIAFTNYKYSLPLDNTDERRWWIIFCNIKSLNDIRTITGESPSEWFDNLYSFTREYAGEILKHYLQFNISNEFKNTIVAPQTKYKKSMVLYHHDSIDGYSEFLDLIAENNAYYNENYITSKIWTDIKPLLNTNILITGWFKTRLIRSEGYNKLPFKVKIQGDFYWVWSKQDYKNVEQFIEHNIFYLSEQNSI